MMLSKPSRRLFIISAAVITVITSITIFSFSGRTRTKLPYEKPLAERITVTGLENFYKLSDSVYRSEQPDNKEMKELEKMGIKTVLNLRNYHNDNNEAKGTYLTLERIRMNAEDINYEKILAAMKIIKNSPKPILIHCLHGSDRTGCIVASYRIVFQNWTKEAAIKELKNPVFGYHASWFPNILVTLNTLEVDKMRKELGLR